MNKKKIIIDTDLGDDVDDAAAIALAINSPEIDIKGITTVYKNTPHRAQMVRDLLKLYNREDIPVYIGHGMPVIERPNTQEEPIQYEVLKRKYEIEQSKDAVDFIIDTILKDPDVSILEMGPQTNLGLAFLKNPEVMKNAKIIGMGGAFLNSYPEWNIICDPEAARIVMDFAQHLILFGLDVTKFCRLTEEQFKIIVNSADPAVQYLYRGMQMFMKRTGYPITLHDALLIAYLIDETVIVLKQGDYTVELKGELTRGTIVHKTDYYTMTNQTDKAFYYAVDLDTEKFGKMMMERVFH